MDAVDAVVSRYTLNVPECFGVTLRCVLVHDELVIIFFGCVLEWK